MLLEIQFRLHSPYVFLLFFPNFVISRYKQWKAIVTIFRILNVIDNPPFSPKIVGPLSHRMEAFQIAQIRKVHNITFSLSNCSRYSTYWHCQTFRYAAFPEADNGKAQLSASLVNWSQMIAFWAKQIISISLLIIKTFVRGIMGMQQVLVPPSKVQH